MTIPTEALRLHPDGALHPGKPFCALSTVLEAYAELCQDSSPHLQAALEALGTGLARKAVPSQSLTRAISSLKEKMVGPKEAPTGPKVLPSLWLLNERDRDSY